LIDFSKAGVFGQATGESELTRLQAAGNLFNHVLAVTAVLLELDNILLNLSPDTS
jgi:hypothetical protein